MPPAAHDHDHERTIVARPTGESTLQPGAKILNDTYVIEAVLGQGGMGEVYKAEHIELAAKRAIKIIIPQFARDPQYVSLFIEEARKLSNVYNDAIVRYYEFSRDEGGARYLVMEFVDGPSLADVIKSRKFKPPEVVRLLERVGYGLTAAYEQGIKAHRDLSPGNIILPQGSVDLAKVIDFGIAKAEIGRDPTALSDGAGKEQYKSPEQNGMFGGAATVDQRSDIYSLGLVLAAAALGKQLDMGSDMASRYIARQSVPNLGGLSQRLRPLIGWMLEPDPEKRPQSMRMLLEELGRMTEVPTQLGGSAAPAGRPAGPASAIPVRRLERQASRSWLTPRSLAIAGGGIVVAGAIAAGAYFFLRPNPATPETIRADIADTVGGFQCADVSYSVGPDRVASVSGFVSTDDDLKLLSQHVERIPGIAGSHLDVRLRAWPYCAAAAVLKPIVGGSGPSAPGLTLASADTVARLGAPIALDVRAPAFDGYAYIDYYNSAGQVTHLYPNDKDALNFRPARNSFVVGKPPQAGMQRCWVLSGDTGERLVTYIASGEPLFAAPRPVQENAKDYLAALSNAVSAGSQQVARLLFFDLQSSNGERHAETCSMD
ncbi:MAG TPA: serine/threonine-protein kinase [Stellaceae bacterium]|nr:serine/threonine-protein kinase [Stellaceae bacterium]